MQGDTVLPVVLVSDFIHVSITGNSKGLGLLVEGAAAEAKQVAGGVGDLQNVPSAVHCWTPLEVLHKNRLRFGLIRQACSVSQRNFPSRTGV